MGGKKNEFTISMAVFFTGIELICSEFAVLSFQYARPTHTHTHADVAVKFACQCVFSASCLDETRETDILANSLAYKENAKGRNPIFLII